MHKIKNENIDTAVRFIGSKMTSADTFASASEFTCRDLWSGEESVITGRAVSVRNLPAHGDAVFKLTPVK